MAHIRQRMRRRDDAGRRAEIARRHARKTRPKVSMAALRVAELRRLFGCRYGHVLPDDDAGREDLTLMLHHLARRPGDAARHLAMCIEVWAPWMMPTEVGTLIPVIVAKPLKFRADTLGVKLNLTDAERTRLAIRTIGAVDLDRAKRKERRREQNRELRRQQRRVQGAKPRAEYEAQALLRTKPWLSFGISERTWYRRGKPTACAA